jgi:hypothetical protein
MASGEPSQSAGAAADVEHALAVEVHDLGDLRGLDSLTITAVSSALQARPDPAAHPRFTARIVDPIAPYFFAFRRVSSNSDRAYVSTRSPCSMSV